MTTLICFAAVIVYAVAATTLVLRLTRGRSRRGLGDYILTSIVRGLR